MHFKMFIFLTVWAQIALFLSLASANEPNLLPSFLQIHPHTTNQNEAAIEALVRSQIKSTSVRSPEWKNPALFLKYKDLVVRYVQYLMLDPVQDQKLIQNTIKRLLNSQMVFLNCSDMEDWSCLESAAEISPDSLEKIELSPLLGKKQLIGEDFRYLMFFTQQWKQNVCNPGSIDRIKELATKERIKQHCAQFKLYPESLSVAQHLAAQINKHADKELLMALYGIDDTEDSMKDVYQAIINKKNSGVTVQGVFDITKEGAANSFTRDYDIIFNPITNKLTIKKDIPIDYSYVNPIHPNNWMFGRPHWMSDLFTLGQKIKSGAQTNSLSVLNPKADALIPKETKGVMSDIRWLMGLGNPETAQAATRMAFQYKGTFDLIQELNAGIKDNESANARIEYPMDNIMHNKFIIMKDKNDKEYLWTGTTNVARTCMGNEENANLAMLIENNTIAQVFRNEFYEMFRHDPVENTSLPKTLVTGLFHNTKRPNTARYFEFKDGTEVKVHFSPTDDAEHRALLPMLLSARKGDQIRISMFGGTGLEFVRAMQYAVSRGATIQIAFDNTTGSGVSSWWKASVNVLQANPYITADIIPGSIEVRNSTWPGLNHHKTASLTRHDEATQSYRPEILVVGSQNWSASGNDQNDENVLTIRHKTKPLVAASRFNTEFDLYIWNLSEPVNPNAKMEAAAALSDEAQ